MSARRLLKLLRTHCVWLCVAFAALAALQPFLSTHFREDGWEDEPALRFATVGQSVQFEADDRPQFLGHQETTVFVSPGADIAQPDALALGLLAFAALAALAVGLLVRSGLVLRPPAYPYCAPLTAHQGAPPPPPRWRCWQMLPPAAAPPTSN